MSYADTANRLHAEGPLDVLLRQHLGGGAKNGLTSAEDQGLVRPLQLGLGNMTHRGLRRIRMVDAAANRAF